MSHGGPRWLSLCASDDIAHVAREKCVVCALLFILFCNGDWCRLVSVSCIEFYGCAHMVVGAFIIVDSYEYSKS